MASCTPRDQVEGQQPLARQDALRRRDTRKHQRCLPPLFGERSDRLLSRYRTEMDYGPRRLLGEAGEIRRDERGYLGVSACCLPVAHQYDRLTVARHLDVPRDDAVRDDIEPSLMVQRRPGKTRSHPVRQQAYGIGRAQECLDCVGCEKVVLRAEHDADDRPHAGCGHVWQQMRCWLVGRACQFQFVPWRERPSADAGATMDGHAAHLRLQQKAARNRHIGIDGATRAFHRYPVAGNEVEGREQRGRHVVDEELRANDDRMRGSALDDK